MSARLAISFVIVLFSFGSTHAAEISPEECATLDAAFTEYAQAHRHSSEVIMDAQKKAIGLMIDTIEHPEIEPRVKATLDAFKPRKFDTELAVRAIMVLKKVCPQ